MNLLIVYLENFLVDALFTFKVCIFTSFENLHLWDPVEGSETFAAGSQGHIYFHLSARVYTLTFFWESKTNKITTEQVKELIRISRYPLLSDNRYALP